MSSISAGQKLSLITETFFPVWEWKDKNGDGKAQKSELIRSSSYSRLKDRSKAKALEAEHNSLFRSIDKYPKDECLTMKEVDRFLSKTPSKIEIDAAAALRSLRTDGVYRPKDVPVIVYLSNSVPSGLAGIVTDEFMSGKYDFWTAEISKYTALSPERSREGKNKFAAIVVNSYMFPSMDKLQFESGLQHELVHVQQYFSGQNELISGIMTKVIRSAMNNPAMSQKGREFWLSFTDDMDSVLSEPQAHLVNVRHYLQAKDPQALQFKVQIVNGFIYTGRLMIDVLNSVGETRLAGLLGDMIRDTLNNSLISSINTSVKKLGIKDALLKKRCMIDTEMTRERFLDLYRGLKP